MPGQKTCYIAHLIVDETVIDLGTTENCRHALHGAYQALMGIRFATATVRAGGHLICTLETDWKGCIREIEFVAPRHFRKDGRPYRTLVTQQLNPSWKGWPGFVNTVKGRCPVALLTTRSEACSDS